MWRVLTEILNLNEWSARLTRKGTKTGLWGIFNLWRYFVERVGGWMLASMCLCGVQWWGYGTCGVCINGRWATWL